MKKLISLLLVVILVCSALAGCDWNSIFNRNEPTIDEDTKMKQMYLSQFKIQNLDAEDVVIDYDGGTYNGARIVMLDAHWHARQGWGDRIGETTILYYDYNELLAYKSETFYTLNEAKEQLILSDEQIQLIATDFQSKVTHFRDTCDVHDFPKYYFNDNFDKYDGYMPRDDMIYVDIDTRIVKDNEGYESFDVVEYLGPELIKSSENIIRRNPDYYRFSLYINHIGYENIPYICEELSKIPGVLSAGYYFDFFDFGA